MLISFVVALCGIGGTAQAGSALLVTPLIEGPVLANELAKMRSSVEQAVKAQQLELVPESDLESALSGDPELRGCYSAPCLERLGRLFQSHIVLRYRVRMAAAEKKNPTWHLNVEVLDVEVGAFGSRLTEDCPDCTGPQVAARLGDMVQSAVLENASQPRGLLEIVSVPSSAAVFVDGTELGITPYKRGVFAGKRKVALRHLGYRSEQIEVDVEEGQRQRVERTLVAGKDPVQIVVIEKTPLYKKWWFWVAIGGATAAAAAITTGVVLANQPPGLDRTPPPNTFLYSF